LADRRDSQEDLPIWKVLLILAVTGSFVYLMRTPHELSLGWFDFDQLSPAFDLTFIGLGGFGIISYLAIRGRLESRGQKIIFVTVSASWVLLLVVTYLTL